VQTWNEADIIRIKHTKEDMMSLHRKLLAVAVAGALTAATAVPALALENEFHGMFQLQYDNSNFNGSTNNLDAAGARYTPGNQPKDAPTANFFEQRARLAYIAKASQDFKLVTKFELDYRFWGNSSYTVGRNQGGALGADTVNLETKNIYLDTNIPSLKLNTKFGMQPVDDAFKGIFVSADMAGILFNHEYGKATASAGFFRWNDTPTAALGGNARDFFMLDGKYKVTGNTKLGAAYYFVNSDATDVKDGNGDPLVEDLAVHLLGVNAETTVGPITIDGFVLYQFGSNYSNNTNPLDNNKHRSAFAGNVGVRAKAGKGTMRSEFLYVTGEGNLSRKNTNAFFTPANFQYSESGFWNNEMVILGRDKYAMTNDASIVFDANNKSQGVIFGTLGYDHPVTNKLTTSVNAGFAAVAKENANKPVNRVSGKTNDSNYLGTEINAEAAYKLAESVTLTARGGYVFLGDYYKDVASNGTPDNPYDFKLIVSYSF
jgi:hypothetical protein